MCDFLVQFGDADLRRMKGLLRDRPGMADARLHEFEFPWGGVVIQEPRGRGYAPHKSAGGVFACVARPRFVGLSHEERGPEGFNRILAERFAGQSPQATFDACTGMYALLRLDHAGVDLITDQMGFQSVYRTTRTSDGAGVIGTHLEAVAELSGRTTDWDPVSLGELLTFSQITFPHTSRADIRELASASHYRFDDRSGSADPTTLWRPVVGDPFATDDEAVDAVSAALQTAVVDVTRGCPRVAVTLSGGMDSRTLMATVPRDQRAAAMTYVGRENREVEIAAEIAAVCGAHHVLVPRDDEYYTTLLLERGPSLLGIERRGAAHGFCVVDNDLQHDYDLVLGGQLSDTFFKDHFMPKARKEQLRPKLWRERLKRRALDVIGIKSKTAQAGVTSTAGRHLMLKNLRPDIAAAVRERRERRVADIAEIRAQDAEEWSRFWPTSRQDDLAHVCGNMKLFAFDSPFMHRNVVDVSCRLTERQRYAGRVANLAFRKLFGPELGRIQNANTGLPAEASSRDVAQAKRREFQGKQQEPPTQPRSATPWNDVSGSWIDMGLLQQYSPAWQVERAKLDGSPAMQTLHALIEGDVGRGILAYDKALSPAMNAMAVQLTRTLNAKLRGGAGAAVPGDPTPS